MEAATVMSILTVGFGMVLFIALYAAAIPE